MKDKTAVEWLESKIIEDLRLDDLLSGYYSKEQYRQFLRDKINQALEIEKQQIMDAHKNGLNNGYMYHDYKILITSEQYYSQTYKK